MKKLLPILLLCLLAFSASAQSIITATVTVTNAAGTTNGQTITVNGSVRTWTNNVQVAASQILTNNTAGGSATNLFVQLQDYTVPAPVVFLNWSATNTITIQGVIGSVPTVTVSAGWATVVFTTNTPVGNGYIVRVPITVEPGAQQTNISSFVVSALDLSTNSASGTDIAFSNYVNIVAAQTVIGAKALTNVAGLWQGIVSNAPSIGGKVFAMTNGYYTNAILDNPTGTNGAFYALSAPGSAAFSEAFGKASSASAASSTAIGRTATASGINSTAAGQGALASGLNSIVLGSQGVASGSNSISVGYGGNATGSNSVALGFLASATFDNSVAIGRASQSTAANQVMLGAANISTVVQNWLHVGGGLDTVNGATNLWTTGTNTFLAGSDIAFTRNALTSLANGNNADIPVGTNVFVEVSGPTGAFTVNGINGQPNRDGKFLILLNRTGQNMTIANDSGVDATAANRIYCLTAADKSVTGNSAALLIYNANVTHWICIYFGQ